VVDLGCKLIADSTCLIFLFYKDFKELQNFDKKICKNLHQEDQIWHEPFVPVKDQFQQFWMVMR
jgi:hypothetical protein